MGALGFGHTIYHNRNSIYIPTYGRFLQRDPNQTAMMLLSGSHSGVGVGPISLAFSLEGFTGDGMNLYQYLQSNPLLRRDPMGLSSDPFQDSIDSIIMEHRASGAAFLSGVGQDAKAAAVTAATIASYLPFPVAGIMGDLALWAMGEQSGAMTVAAITLGVIPGGKLIGKLGGRKIAKLVSGYGASLWKGAKHYARIGGKFLRGGGFAGAGARLAGKAIGSIVDRAGRWLDRKPRAVACGCFTASTLVLTPAGAVPIDQIGPDAMVYAAPDDAAPGTAEAGRVAQQIIVDQASLVHLVLEHADGSAETIHTTDEHPFHKAALDRFVGNWTEAAGGTEIESVLRPWRVAPRLSQSSGRGGWYRD